MAKTTSQPLETSPSSTELAQAAPGSVPAASPDPRIDVVAFRESKEGKALVAWASGEFSRCKGLKVPKQRQWYTNMAMVFGQQWLQVTTGQQSGGKLQVQPAPRWMRRKTINRLRSYVRTETSKFLSTLPNIVSVPSTAEDEDVRAAYAAEQTWMSYSETKKFRKEYSAAIWWMVLTGTGFIKQWWDPAQEVKMPDGSDFGDISFRKISPFNIFVPEMREADIEDQPYVIEARVRPLEWVKTFYKEQLADAKLTPSTNAANTLLDEAYLNLQKSENSIDSVVVTEFWVKPGATPHLPKGGLLILVEDVLVDYHEGMPYNHGEFPYTKFDHLYTDTFWADSPLVDLIPLQKEYNDARTDISVAARRMGNPQLLVQEGSVTPSKMTNEPGSMIIYKPGMAPPAPSAPAQIPQFVLEQQDRILSDFEDISGQHEVSRGTAPAGITAGTALAYLGERDDNYLTPQYQGVEDGVERTARQTLLLFQQYVDMKRKIKVVGLDGAYDTLLLTGADIQNGTDVRVEPGTGVGQSQAAKQAQVMDLVSLGIIDGPTALKMMEIGGPQKVLDIISAAERKAQRENMKMKALKDNPGLIQQAEMEFLDTVMKSLVDPMTGTLDPADPGVAQAMQMAQEMVPPVVQVDDFDIHEVHIETHNRFRMSQEYEALPDEVKEQFDKHVSWHQQMGAASMQAQLMEQMPPDMAGAMEEGPDSIAPTEDTGPAPVGPMA